jgi:hypothetical protein
LNFFDEQVAVVKMFSCQLHEDFVVDVVDKEVLKAVKLRQQ